MNRLVMDIFNNGVSSFAVSSLNLPERLQIREPTLKSLVDGGAQTLAEKIVDYFQGKELNFNYKKIADDVLFNTLVYELINRFGVGSVLYSFISEVQIPDMAKQVLFRGVLSAGARTVYETMDQMENLRFHPLFRYVLHPSDFLQQV